MQNLNFKFNLDHSVIHPIIKVYIYFRVRRLILKKMVQKIKKKYKKITNKRTSFNKQKNSTTNLDKLFHLSKNIYHMDIEGISMKKEGKSSCLFNFYKLNSRSSKLHWSRSCWSLF